MHTVKSLLLGALLEESSSYRAALTEHSQLRCPLARPFEKAYHWGNLQKSTVMATGLRQTLHEGYVPKLPVFAVKSAFPVGL